MLTLYQFPISHYCEKVRWALDYKGLRYKCVNLLPGLHTRTTRRLAASSSVPVLLHGKNAVQGSDAIITYLDQHFPQHRLTPVDEAAATQALEWERFADTQLGPHVRRICYHTLLHHPDIVIPFFAHKGPWYSRLYLRGAYPTLAKTMRKLMDIQATSVDASETVVTDALDTIVTALDTRDYLVGDAFSRADLSVAALLAPITQPEGYGLPWPPSTPEPLAGLANSWRPALAFVDRWYASHRRAA